MSDQNKRPGFIFQTILFIILAAGCVLLYIFLSNHKGKNIVSISTKSALDSQTITRWDVIPNGDMNKIYTVFEDSNIWKVRLQDHSIVDADLSIVKRSLRHFTRFDNAIPVNFDKTRWKAEGLEDNGNRVVVYEGDHVSGNYIIGKLEFIDQYKASYYIRPVNSDSVYLVKEIYLDGSMLAPDHNFRKRIMNGIDPYYYKTVRVVSPDTNVYYLLENVKGTWSIDGREINQNRVLNYIKMLSLIQAPEFASGTVKNPPEASVTIETKFGPVVLAASREQNEKWVLASSVNVGNRLELTPPQVYAVFPPFHYFMQE